ncbi:MAG: acetate--CoA ligase [Myxococcales bacterium FL481]|nr:MAG: acetate--CoA ligase [Myxococcales bacterium FL481]
MREREQAPTVLPSHRPNLQDYERTRATHSWEDARAELQGLHGGINIGHEAVDRHANGTLAEQPALRWRGKTGERRDWTYQRLQADTNRFANALSGLGLRPGDTVFLLAPRVPELYIAALGALKFGAVVCPLFSAFGPEPIKTRMLKGRAKVVLTTARLYTRKLAPIRAALPDLREVIVVEDDAPEGTVSWREITDPASDDFQISVTDPQASALLHFTSGTTGMPKGAVHVHEAVVVHRQTGRYVLDLRPGDVFWCTADPGWVTGTSYGIVAPLCNGCTLLVYEGEFDSTRWYQLLSDEQVNVWYTAPTAIRMLMKAGVELADRFERPSLRLIASVGEPLNPEAVRWSSEVLGQPIRDNWWQSETGGIMIANYRSLEVKPGSMGKPIPGIETAVIQRGPERSFSTLEQSGEVGELALRAGWPSMFRGYLGEDERYQQCFVDGWYLTGDLVSRDDDGYFWFVGRADDVIKSAGHLVGPFEVESALVEHPAVAEAAVIGKPHETAGAIVKAFVGLNPGYEASEALVRELMAATRKKLGPAVAPREIAIVADLPKTRSGKIMRRLLKARELGLEEGDTSTLEGPST